MLRLARFITVLMLFTYASQTYAGIQISGTRVVYDAGKSQATVNIYNPDTRPYLIQSWVTRNINDTDDDNTFITTPPLFRLEPKSQNSVRIVVNQPPLLLDKESVYWLNIKAIPATDKPVSNVLLIAVKNKMKLFYRPQGLSGSSSTAYQNLQTRLENNELYIFNPTSYSVSFYEFRLNGAELTNLTMILPGQEVNAGKASQGSVITWRAINDMGGITESQTRKL